MKFRDLVVSAYAGLLQQKMRTLLTVSSVTLGAMLLFCSLSGRLGVLSALQDRLAVGDRLLRIDVRGGFKPPPKSVMHKIERQIPAEVTGERRKRMAELLAMKAPQRGQYVSLNLERLRSIRQIEGIREVVPDLAVQNDILLNGTIKRTRVQSVRANNKSIVKLIVLGKGLSSNSANEALVSEAWLYQRGLRTDRDFKGILGQSLWLCRVPRTAKLSPEQLKVVRTSLELRERVLASKDAQLTNEQRKMLRSEVAQFEEQLSRHDQRPAPIEAQSQPLRVVGIYKSPTESFQSDAGLVDAFYSSVLIPADTLAEYRLFVYPGRPVKTGSAEVKAAVICKDTESAKRVLKRLKDEGFTCSSFASLAFRIRSAVVIVTGIVTAIAIVAFLIAALGMTNTMVMNVLERRREIGILKAVGARDRDVLRMFLVEGLAVGLIGGVLGLIAGVVFIQLCEEYLRGLLERRLDEAVPAALFALPLWLAVFIPASACIVTVVASVIPARRASTLDPVRTLRNL